MGKKLWPIGIAFVQWKENSTLKRTNDWCNDKDKSKNHYATWKGLTKKYIYYMLQSYNAFKNAN